ncbi:unnamed protein product [Sphagnum balticum]
MRASVALSGVAFGADLPLACGKTSTTGSSAHSSYHPSSSAQVLAIAISSSSSSGSSPSPGCSCPDFCQYQQGALPHQHDQQHGKPLARLRGFIQAVTPSSEIEVSNQQLEMLEMVELRETKLWHLCHEEV